MSSVKRSKQQRRQICISTGRNCRWSVFLLAFLCSVPRGGAITPPPLPPTRPVPLTAIVRVGNPKVQRRRSQVQCDMKHRLALILPAYMAAYVACYWVAFQLRFDFDPDATYSRLLQQTLSMVLAIKFAVCLLTSEFDRTYRHTTIRDVLHLGMGSVFSTAVLWAVNTTLPVPIPRGVLCIDLITCVGALNGLRLGYRAYQEFIRPRLQRVHRLKTLVYGVDESAVGLLKMVDTAMSEASPYRVVGFVHDGKTRTTTISGLPVYGTSQGWQTIQDRSRAVHLLVPGDAPGRAVRELLHPCADVGIKVSVIPTVSEVVSGRVKMGTRDVEVADLLRREPNRLDLDAIRACVTGKRVLVTGGAGSIGGELCRQVLDLEPAELVLLDQSEFGVFSMEQEFTAAAQASPIIRAPIHYVVADVLDTGRLDQVFAKHSPQIVFHAAAYKHVPLMEDNPQSAVLNNIQGTRNTAEAADRHQAERFVLISTDKAVRPTSVMGATKLLSEKFVQALSLLSSTRFITVRFGNVLDSMGSVVPTFRRQLAVGGPLTVTHPDMQRFFMTIPEAVQLVLQSAAAGESGDVLILDMGEPVRIFDLARDMICLSGLKYPEDIDITFTGIRPGEKLFEELFYTAQQTNRRVHEKIHCGDRDAVPPMPRVIAELNRLIEAAEKSPHETLLALQDIVARYTDVAWISSRLVKAA